MLADEHTWDNFFEESAPWQFIQSGDIQPGIPIPQFDIFDAPYCGAASTLHSTPLELEPKTLHEGAYGTVSRGDDAYGEGPYETDASKGLAMASPHYALDDEPLFGCNEGAQSSLYTRPRYTAYATPPAHTQYMEREDKIQDSRLNSYGAGQVSHQTQVSDTQGEQLRPVRGGPPAISPRASHSATNIEIPSADCRDSVATIPRNASVENSARKGPLRLPDDHVPTWPLDTQNPPKRRRTAENLVKEHPSREGSDGASPALPPRGLSEHDENGMDAPATSSHHSSDRDEGEGDVEFSGLIDKIPDFSKLGPHDDWLAALAQANCENAGIAPPPMQSIHGDNVDSGSGGRKRKRCEPLPAYLKSFVRSRQRDQFTEHEKKLLQRYKNRVSARAHRSRQRTKLETMKKIILFLQQENANFKNKVKILTEQIHQHDP